MVKQASLVKKSTKSSAHSLDTAKDHSGASCIYHSCHHVKAEERSI